MKTILILGAVSDMATAIAHRYAKEGYQIILAGRQAEKRLQPLSKDLSIRYGVTAYFVEFDALDFDNHETFYSSLPESPNIAICVFGTMGDEKRAYSDTDAMRQILDTNYTGAVSILNVIANHFEKRKSGSIVGISSVAGDRGRQSNYLYGSAKAGFTAYLSGLRNRLTPAGVEVLTVKPGFVATSMTQDLNLPPLLTASPEKVAQDIFKAVAKKKNQIYTPWFWRFIMLIIRSIPESIFKKLKL